MKRGRKLESLNPISRRAGVFIDKRKPGGSPQIAVRFDLDTFSELRKRASKRSLPLAKIVRELVGASLSR